VAHWLCFYGSGQLPDGSTRPVAILGACPCSRAAPTREVPGVCDPSPPRLRAHSQLEAGAGWQLVCPNVFALYGLRRPICPWTRLQPTTAPSNSRRGWDGTRPAEPVVTSGVGAQRADSVLVNHSKDSSLSADERRKPYRTGKSCLVGGTQATVMNITI